MNDDVADEEWDYQLEDLDDEQTPDTVDPGDPSAEGVAFVVLGALLTLFVFGRVAGLV